MERDALYWTMYRNIKSKHPDWDVKKLHAVAGQMRRNYVVEYATE